MTQIDLHDDICFLQLSSPPHNYIERPAFADIEKIESLFSKDKFKAIIISGEGRNFSAGADMNELKHLWEKHQLAEAFEEGKLLLKRLHALHMPIISCIEGVCFGGGLEIALTADIKIAAHNALFAFPETGYDLIPGLGGNHRITGLTGKSNSYEIILKGDTFNAEQAKELGVIDYITEKKQTLKKGTDTARKLVHGNSLEVIQAVTELIRMSDTEDYDRVMKRETELFCRLAEKAAQKL